MVYSTYLPENTTTQEYGLSSYIRGAWAKFAKNPMDGPGWNPIGTGVGGPVLVGAYDIELGGVYAAVNGSALEGAWDLGVLGNSGNSMGSGVTVIDQYEVDYRCGLYTPLYAAAAGLT